MKILWLTNIPSPYRVDFFNEFGKHCELTVLFEKDASDERDDSWKNFKTDNFKAVFLPGKSVKTDSAFCISVIKYLKKNTYDHIVVSNFFDITGIIAIFVLRLKKIPYIVESDGGFAGKGFGIKERFKRWLLKKADLYFSTAKLHDDYYVQYGATPEKILRYPFTSLYEKDILSSPVDLTKKAYLRMKWNITEPKVIVAVGQFIHRKGFDILIKSMAKVESNVGCYIIGGKPPKEYDDLISSLKLKNVHFVDFLSKSDLAEFYMAADAFVHPTREDIWGLVINEAMAKGLPVITTDRCIAGLEIIKSDSVGRIVHTEDIEELAKAITYVLRIDDSMMNKCVLNTISKYTIEKMAKYHIDVLESACRR